MFHSVPNPTTFRKELMNATILRGVRDCSGCLAASYLKFFLLAAGKLLEVPGGAVLKCHTYRRISIVIR